MCWGLITEDVGSWGRGFDFYLGGSQLEWHSGLFKWREVTCPTFLLDRIKTKLWQSSHLMATYRVWGGGGWWKWNWRQKNEWIKKLLIVFRHRLLWKSHENDAFFQKYRHEPKPMHFLRPRWLVGCSKSEKRRTWTMMAICVHSFSHIYWSPAIRGALCWVLRTDPVSFRGGPQKGMAVKGTDAAQLSGLKPCQVSWANILNPSALRRYFTDSTIATIIFKGIPIKHLEFMACREISAEP